MMYPRPFSVSLPGHKKLIKQKFILIAISTSFIFSRVNLLILVSNHEEMFIPELSDFLVKVLLKVYKNIMSPSNYDSII